MVKIREIKAIKLNGRSVAARAGKTTTPRRPAWHVEAEVANPMSGYDRFKRLRASWRYDEPVGVIVISDDGTFGFGITQYSDPVIHLVNDHFAPLLVGENAMATDRLWDMMVRMSSPYGSTGIASMAISAIDLALWDLKGKLLKAPVYEIAGGPTRDSLFCYATGNDTDWHMELGFKATKLACPYGMFDGLSAIDKNEEFVARTREQIGRDVELMLDCWMAFDVEFAVRLADRLRPYGLRWIEDCLLPDNADAHRSLRERLPWMTLATGEHWYSQFQFAHAARLRYADIFQPDIAWSGGFTGLTRINHIAEGAGIEVILHAGMNTAYGQHFSFANANVRWGEYFSGGGPGVPLAETVQMPGQAVPVDGRLVPNGEPGFGLGMTEAIIDEMRA
jgi:L-rhamnonate dehydratase